MRMKNTNKKWLAEKTDKERAGFINALYGKD